MCLWCVHSEANTTLVRIKSFNGTSQPYGIQYTIKTAMKWRERIRKEKKEEGWSLFHVLVSLYMCTVIESSRAPEGPGIELSMVQNSLKQVSNPINPCKQLIN